MARQNVRFYPYMSTQYSAKRNRRNPFAKIGFATIWALNTSRKEINASPSPSPRSKPYYRRYIHHLLKKDYRPGPQVKLFKRRATSENLRKVKAPKILILECRKIRGLYILNCTDGLSARKFVVRGVPKKNIFSAQGRDFWKINYWFFFEKMTPKSKPPL